MDKNILSGEQDQAYIRFALNLAKKNIGLTCSNPVVGSVLVKDNTIISLGITGKNGVPHSENIAILKAGNKAIGATLYVTLEPCCHFGKTPPCTDLIIQSKISRVVIATKDPDLRVNGLGIKKLQEAGIKILVGVLEDEAKNLNSGFFNIKTKKMPLVTLKLATSLDGKIATKNGDSKWITSEKSRQYAHYLRAKNDAILVGAQTIRQDNAMLDCRILGLEGYSPKRIILSKTLNIDLNSKIIQTARQIPTYIATNNQNTQKLIDFGVQIINFDNLKDLLVELKNIGVNNLLVEGGSSVATQLIADNLIDNIIWIQSTKVIGNDGTTGIGNFNITKIIQALNFKKTSTRSVGEDLILKLKKLP
jgi:diaminohydroxyphosphoribosylaminopyrimidine deaminase/5-amino-6-(5-phosphoribosylamino)uracil reductase